MSHDDVEMIVAAIERLTDAVLTVATTLHSLDMTKDVSAKDASDVVLANWRWFERGSTPQSGSLQGIGVLIEDECDADD